MLTITFTNIRIFDRCSFADVDVHADARDRCTEAAEIRARYLYQQQTPLTKRETKILQQNSGE